MSATVVLAKHAVTEFDLPAVCVASGATEDVRYYPVKFSFVPMWARLSVAFCGLIGLVLMLASVRRVAVELPFTDDAFARFTRVRHAPPVLAVFAVLSLMAPLLLAPDQLAVGIVAFLGLLLAAIYASVVVKGLGPVCKGIDETSVVLEIPSQAAADAIEERLGGPPEADGPAGGEVDAYDRELEKELEAFDGG